MVSSLDSYVAAYYVSEPLCSKFHLYPSVWGESMLLGFWLFFLFGCWFFFSKKFYYDMFMHCLFQVSREC